MRRGMSLPLIIAALLLIGPAIGAEARGRVNIQDDAGVLSSGDKQSIQQAAQSAPFDTTVLVIKGGYSGNERAFVSMANRQAGSDQVVIALDTTDRFDHVAARQNTGLTSAETTQAKQSARSNFTGQDWGGGITAIIRSLAQVAPAGGTRPNNRQTNPAPIAGAYAPPYQNNSQSGGGFPLGSLLLIALVIGGLVMLARRMMGGGRQPLGYGPGMNQTMNQPGMGGPNNMNPGYGPGYNQGGYNQGGHGGGIGGGLMAGGLGAVGGGLLGYELGKSAGEHENQQGGYADGGNNDPGGIVQSDDGSSNTPDFGGGDTGGGDFGGGGGDFGGGGDMGGGGTDF